MDVEIDSDAVDGEEAVVGVITVALDAFTTVLSTPDSSEYAMGNYINDNPIIFDRFNELI
jgi:hypothetical protein